MVMTWSSDWWMRGGGISVLVLLQLTGKSWTKTVYMDRYGDCFRKDSGEGPFDVVDDTFTILSQGGDAYDTLNCELNFKSVKNDRLCLNFRKFLINKCDVKLNIYSEPSASGNSIGSYSCYTDEVPSLVCSTGRYLTVKLQKGELSHDGYDFNLELREFTNKDAFAEGNMAFIVSIGMIVGIIVGVIVIVIFVAIIIVCCCCNNRRYNVAYRRSGKSTSCRTAATDVPIEPSAPPFPVEEPPAYMDHPPPYTCSNDKQDPLEEKAFV